MVTTKDIARQAGVSVRMVERVLSGVTQGKRRDARERAERIRKLAEEQGYHPSEVALSLKRGSTMTIGLLVPCLTDMFYAMAAEVAMNEAARHGYSIIIRLTRFSPQTALDNITRFRASGVDGILYGEDTVNLDPTAISRLKKQKFPFMTFSHGDPLRFSTVLPDHTPAIRQAVAELAAAGHSLLTMALYLEKSTINQIDGQAFQCACKEYGVSGKLIFYERIKDFAQLVKIRPEALLINGKYAIRSFLDSAASDPGYKPELIGFYNEWTWAQAPTEKLRGVVLEQADLTIRVAVTQMVKQIADKTRRNVMIPSAFHARDHFQDIQSLNLANQYPEYDVR